MNRCLVTVAVGCAIAAGLIWPRNAAPHNPITTTVLFNREIAKIFQQKCLSCHRDGALSMPLTTYEEARPWAVAIKEEILARQMPPWSAESGYGEFANNVGLTGRERDFLISWIDGGAPKGEVEPPAFIDHGAHWMLGTPDALLTANAGVRVDPGRAVGFTRLIIDTGLAQDKWLRGFDYKPGDLRVVRAAFLSVAGTGQYLGAWTPWRSSMQLPDGVGIRLPAKSQIAIDVLYQPASSLVMDTPRIGLYFTPKRPTREVTTRAVAPVAAGATEPVLQVAGTRLRGSARLVMAKDTSIVELRPTLDSGGRSIEVKARRPDGSSQVLLWIKQFRQDWQTSYVFKEPLMLPRGSTLEAVAYFDPAAKPSASPFTLTFNGFDATAAPATAGSSRRPPGSTR